MTTEQRDLKHIIIPMGYSIDLKTGEKRPLTKEQEEWSNKAVAKSMRNTK